MSADPSDATMAAATCPDVALRGDAAEQLARWADRPQVAVVLARLLLDAENTAVTVRACEALLRRNDIHGIRLIVRAVVQAPDPEYLDHIYCTVSEHLLPAGPLAPFLDACTTLVNDPDPVTSAGASELLRWTQPWAGRTADRANPPRL